MTISIRAVVALTAAACFLGASAPAGAADRGTFTLTKTSHTASWSGELVAGAWPGLPEQCVSSDVCDFVYVRVKLPEGVWDKPGGMLVAVKPRAEFANLFNLYVYGPGDEPVIDKPIDKSENTYSGGNQAVWVENPADGLYTVVVAPYVVLGGVPGLTATYPPATYDGFVSFDRGLTVKREELNNGDPHAQTFVVFGVSSPTPAVELLPDLVPTIGNFHIETGACTTPSFYLCNSWVFRQPSCYPEETAGLTSIPPTPGQGPTRCLRFNHGEYNFGDGPLEIHLYPGKGTITDEGLAADIYQRIYSSDGKITQRVAGPAIFHHAHGHYHNLQWRTAALYERRPDGTLGDLVATMPEKGVCTVDVRNGRFGQRRDSPLVYGNTDPAPCVNPSHQDPNPDAAFPNESFIRSGISVGWADIYPWSLVDQYIDISNVRDGKYVIVAQVDAKNLIREKRETNNTVMACVEISGTTARAC